VLLGDVAYGLVAQNALKKGDALAVAQLAGVMGAKQTSSLIPLCHNILLSKVAVELSLEPARQSVRIRATATAVGPTGVEMEALTAVSVAALTVYDMAKAASKEIRIDSIQLESKSGGKGGDYVRRSPR
jgi:molybdenum cofactor biosynthesis protein MoaC